MEEIIKEVAESTLLDHPECHQGRIDLFRGMLYFFLQKAGFEVTSAEIMTKRGSDAHPMFYLRMCKGDEVVGYYECSVVHGSGVSVRKVTKLEAVGLVVPIVMSDGEGPYIIAAACPRNRACEWVPSLQVLSYDAERTEVAEWGDDRSWIDKNATRFATRQDAERILFLLLEERWAHLPPLTARVAIIPTGSLEEASQGWVVSQNAEYERLRRQ